MPRPYTVQLAPRAAKPRPFEREKPTLHAFGIEAGSGEWLVVRRPAPMTDNKKHVVFRAPSRNAAAQLATMLNEAFTKWALE